MSAHNDEQSALGRASTEDIDDVVALLQANETTRGGSITGHFERAQIVAAIGDMPVIVARRRGQLAGVLISSSITAVRHRHVIARMLDAYSGDVDAYVYGPICIDEQHRGQGLAKLLLERLKRELPGREGILFIRQDNARSLRAHAALGIQSRGSFTADGLAYVVLSFRG